MFKDRHPVAQTQKQSDRAAGAPLLLELSVFIIQLSAFQF